MASSEEYIKIIVGLLEERALTTIEVSQLLEQAGAHCPDDLARTLNVMRRKGLIKGAVSTERGGWVWWVEDQGEL